MHKFLPFQGFSGGSVVKNPPADAEGTGSIPGSGRSPGERNGNPLQYCCLGNPMERGTWKATVHGVAKELGHNLYIVASSKISFFFMAE